MDNTQKSNESLANYRYMIDAIWTIYLKDGSVEILKDSMIPELVNTKQNYASLHNIVKKRRLSSRPQPVGRNYIDRSIPSNDSRRLFPQNIRHAFL